MNNPIIIVDPRSSGVELAPLFKSHGIPTIAITFETIKNRLGYGTEIKTSDFYKIIPYQNGLKEILAKYRPFAIIPGAENGVPVVDELSKELTPQFANNPNKLIHRLHKAQMQESLKKANIPYLKTLNTNSKQDVYSWIKENNLENSPLIIKPPISAGSEKVFHIKENENWQHAFEDILNNSSNLTGTTNKTAIIQELAIGTEFSVGTVSARGKHYLSHLIKYNKIAFNNRETIYDYVEFIPYKKEIHGTIFSYTKKVLDALGVSWGASHNEVMLTKDGPRLIESVPRMTGGPVVNFSREATGSSQADKLVEAYLHGDILTRNYELKRIVVPVFLKSPLSGKVLNAEVFDEVSQLPTLFQKYFWFKNGSSVPQTIDYLTSIGIIALSGNRENIFSDYKKIREMESNLIVV